MLKKSDSSMGLVTKMNYFLFYKLIMQRLKHINFNKIL